MTLFPYTTLFRSQLYRHDACDILICLALFLSMHETAWVKPFLTLLIDFGWSIIYGLVWNQTIIFENCIQHFKAKFWLIEQPFFHMYCTGWLHVESERRISTCFLCSVADSVHKLISKLRHFKLQQLKQGQVRGLRKENHIISGDYIFSHHFKDFDLKK